MIDLSNAIHDALEKRLNLEGYDLLELVPIPARGDKMVRIQTLEQILEDFDSPKSADKVCYIVQVRPKSSLAGSSTEPAASTPSREAEGVYLQDGKINLTYLNESAELLLSTGDYGLARNIFITILKSGEATAQALYGIARCYESEGKFDKAETYYRDSVAYQPTLDACQKLAALHIRRKNDEAAAETLERALHLKNIPDHLRLELHKACGNCWLRAKKHDHAERNYKKAIALDPRSDALLANLGALNLQIGKNAEAKRCFQDALSANPRNDKALSGLASVALAENEKRSAHDLFARSLELEINNPTAVYHLVKCAYEIKSYATAARIVEEYIQVAPTNANLLYSLGGLQFHLGRIDEARATAQRILQLQPNHAGAGELVQMADRYSGGVN